ncbi:uncharacterized protein LOC129228623 [Uloborus diversus]|uniref:uncharacterized protein LOC129228623 n=1 Tax=Uloborus diversus TaxID=327109 RepID=UPI00240A71DA|nr:uncharacterized protein LOC129228623 [Uloborus diversus]
MVVATQGKRRERLTSACSDDSLARSLHKDMDYPAVNVSRRSPDDRGTPLQPDSRYPSPARKQQNTMVDTGWHACFKNNNYVFLRNGSFSNDQLEKWKDNNSDITYVISTLKPEAEGQEEKLIVSLQDSKVKIKRTAPSPPDVTNTTMPTEKKTDSSSAKRNKRSDKKKKNGWFQKLKTPNRNRSLKIDATAEETTPIYESSPEESPENSQALPAPNARERKRSAAPLAPAEATPERITNHLVSGPHTSTPKGKTNTDWKSKSLPRGPTPHRPLETRRSVRRRLPYDDDFSPEWKQLASVQESALQESPCYGLELSPGLQNDLDVSQTSISSCANHEFVFVVESEPARMSPQDELDISPLQRRATCHRRIIESPDFQNRMQQAFTPLADIPYADSVEDVSFDDRPRPRTSKINFAPVNEIQIEDSNPFTVTGMSDSDNSGTQQTKKEDSITFNEPKIDDSAVSKSKTLNPFLHSFNDKNKSNFLDIQRKDCFSASKPILESEKTTANDPDASYNCNGEKRSKSLPEMRASDSAVVSRESTPRQVNQIANNNLFSAKRPSGQTLDETPASASPPMNMESKSISISDTSLDGMKMSASKYIDKVWSPMEEEENKSLSWENKHPQSPDDSTVTFSPYKPKGSPARDNPVSCWMKELRLLTESECLNALQAKELIKEDWIAHALAVGNAQESAERIWEVGSDVDKHIQEMSDALKKPTLAVTPFSLKVAQFCSSVVELLKMSSATEQINQVESRIKKSCADLLDTVRKGENREEWKIKITSELQVLQKSVKAIVQQFLFKHLKVIVECVEKATNVNSLKRAVFAVILLGRIDSSFCELMAKLGAVRNLLAICVEVKWKEMHPCALRALTVLSCVPLAIKSFEEGGGVDCICDVLCEEKSSEGARSEAAGLVAQITAPWTEGSGYVLRSVNHNAHRLVRSIAGLASKTQSSEVFLLSSAALANLSFAENILKEMKQNQVLEILVNACRNSSHASSLFIKDQVATVLANMAAKEDYRNVLSSGGSLVLLLCFLQLRPSVGHAAPQLAACERIQQKAAIALARLCTNPETSNVVADMQGIQRLVKLCKDRKERNDSDSVLVACLAALRKIAVTRQKEEFKKLGAQELVEPRLWDAFLAHSSKRESYV